MFVISLCKVRVRASKYNTFTFIQDRLLLRPVDGAKRELDATD